MAIEKYNIYCLNAMKIWMNSVFFLQFRWIDRLNYSYAVLLHSSPKENYIPPISININPCFVDMQYLLCLLTTSSPHVAAHKAQLRLGNTSNVIALSKLKWPRTSEIEVQCAPDSKLRRGGGCNGGEETGRWSEKIQRTARLRRWRMEIKGRWTEDMEEMGQH